MIKKVNKRNCLIKCTSGTLWVTHKNSNDIVLTKGESINLISKKNIFIQKLEDGGYELK